MGVGAQADTEGALRGASHCLRMEPTYSEAHILVAQIHLHDGKHRLAGQALEQAMSHDFAVRESPQFLIMRGKVLTTVGELEEAQKVLEQALGLPGVKAAPSKAALARKAAPVTLGERVSIFMLLVEVRPQRNLPGHSLLGGLRGVRCCWVRVTWVARVEVK